MIELLEHEIVIDEHIKVTLMIPKKLSALELKALMVKSNKLFNLSEVPIINKKKYNHIFSDNMIRDIKALHNKGLKGKAITNELNKIHSTSLSYRTVINKIYVMNKNGQLDKN